MGEWGDSPAAEIHPARHSEIKALMNDLRHECGTEDWDGEGSLPYHVDSFNSAFAFLLYYLPEEIALPQLWCTPQGVVVAEWFNKKASVAISFKKDRTYFFAGYNKLCREILERCSKQSDLINLLSNTLYV